MNALLTDRIQHIMGRHGSMIWETAKMTNYESQHVRVLVRVVQAPKVQA